MTKTIKSIIIYYYIPGIVFVGLAVISMFVMTTDPLGNPSSIYSIMLPVLSLVTGFFAGGAKSYTKWGYSVYILLLTFCIEILFFASVDWSLVLLAFATSLAGQIIRQIIRHIIMIRRAKR